MFGGRDGGDLDGPVLGGRCQVLSIRNLTSAKAAAAYVEADAYYAKGKPPSFWWGTGARSLGLSGPVDRTVFRSMLEGQLPGVQKMRAGARGRRRPGIDLTFSAPKSVSLLAFLKGDRAVIRAHDQAVKTTLSFLERSCARARVERAGAWVPIATENLTVAAYQHASSRAQDPQLHTHAIVLNATKLSDGAWRALTNEAFYRWKKAGGVIYRAELAKGLAQLGYTVQRTTSDGRFEVKGFSDETLRTFSKRRADIEADLDARGEISPEAAALAAVRTRPKKGDTPKHLLKARWLKEAEAIGLSFPKRRKTPTKAKAPIERVCERGVAFALKHLEERDAVFSERDVIFHALARTMGRGLDVASVERLIEQKHENDMVLSAHPKNLDRADPLDRHVTTPEAVKLEASILAELRADRPTEIVMRRDDVEAELEEHQQTAGFSLHEGQKDVVRLALSSKRAIVGVQGVAGAGKTTALGFMREIAEDAGIRVLGAAPTGAAARVIEEEAQIESITLAKLLRDSAVRTEPGERAIWVVDEASMIGNKDADRLLRLARRYEAKLVLVGDRDQLPSVEAGRAFGLLSDHGLERARLTTIVRQKRPELKHAVRDSIGGRHRAALVRLGSAVVEIPERGHRLDRVADAYVESVKSVPDTLVLTGKNEDRRLLNEQIRERLRNEGALSGPSARARVLERKDLTAEGLKDPASYAVGDLVRFRGTRKRLGIAAGEYRIVSTVDPERGRIVLSGGAKAVEFKLAGRPRIEVYSAEERQLAVGDRIRWTKNDKNGDRRNGEVAKITRLEPDRAWVETRRGTEVLDLLREPHWEYAYATTVHAAQGRTTDRIICHIDTTQRAVNGHEAWYVALSRARNEAFVFTNDASGLSQSIRRSMQKESAFDDYKLSQVKSFGNYYSTGRIPRSRGVQGGRRAE